MSTNSKPEIVGIFFENLTELFDSSIISAAKSSEKTLDEFNKLLDERMEKVANSFDESVIKSHLDFAKFNVNSFLESHFINQQQILRNSEKSFHYFILYINACSIFFNKATDAFKTNKFSSTLTMSFGIYGLIVRRSQQIVTLLLDGSIDGSMTIWRSMYEYAIILLTILKENDDSLADAYFEHSIRNSGKKVQSYNTHREELKFPPLSEDTDKILAAEKIRLTEKYGKYFLDSEFGWAAKLFPVKTKVSLRLLEERVEMQRFRPYYILCCEHAHANFNGFKHYMEGHLIIAPRLLQQQMDSDSFIDPMQYTLSILHEVNLYMLEEFSADHEYRINYKFLIKIFESMQKTFEKNDQS